MVHAYHRGTGHPTRSRSRIPRRTLPRGPRSRGASVAAVAITAAAFAALHLPQLAFGVSPLIAVSTFVMGALFGTAAILTGRIGTGIIAHALVNAIVASTVLLH